MAERSLRTLLEGGTFFEGPRWHEGRWWVSDFYRHLMLTVATRLAASGQPMRTIQEVLGHADSKTTQIYAHYAPRAHEVEMVSAAFAEEKPTAAESAEIDAGG
jgi:hypothetical protein